MDKPSAEPRDELLTRWTLVRKLTKTDCDEASWAEFYGIYRKLLHAVARKSGLRPEEAEDVVQETMRSVCEKIRDFNPDPARGSFKAWLLQMARWRITDQFRKRWPKDQADVRADDQTQLTATVERAPDPHAFDLDAAWEAEWQRKLFDAAVERIREQVSPEQFQIFDFYVLRQMPVLKVARSLGVNVGQIYLARHRTLKLIKAEIKGLERKMNS